MTYTGKIHSTGGYSQYIVLPAPWLKERKIGRGDEVEMTPTDDGLIVKPKPSRRK